MSSHAMKHNNCPKCRCTEKPYNVSASFSNELSCEQQLKEERLRVELLRQEIKESAHDDREIADFVNELKKIAVEFGVTQQLRDRISKCVNNFLDA